MDFQAVIESQKLTESPRLNKHMKKVIKGNFNELNLLLDSGTYQHYNWSKIFSKIKESKSQVLSLRRNYKPDIIVDILHINFQFLSSLNLCLNNIQSIEPLVHLVCPNLTQLNLSQNRLLSTRTFRKLPFKLQKLDLMGNPIKQLIKFQEIYFDKQINLLRLDRFSNEKQIGQNLNCLVKLNCQKMIKFNINRRSSLFVDTRMLLKTRFVSLQW